MKKYYRVVVGSVVAVVLLAVVLLCRVRQRLVVSIDGFEVYATDTLNIGQGSDICFNDVPHDFLRVVRNGKGFEWKVSDLCLKNDSLCYFKVNNVNPNIHRLDQGQTVVVKMDGKKYTITAEDVEDMLDDQESQYVLLRNVLEKRRREAGTEGEDLRTRKELRSLFYRKNGGFFSADGPWHLLILDTKTTLEGGGGTISYVTSGTTDSRCKVQFFSVAEYSFQSGEDIFSIGDVNYMAKPVAMRTGWGAGHVMLRSDNGFVAVAYPKPLTYTEDLDVLRQLAGSTTSMLTMQQADGALPVGHCLYLPQYSTLLRQEVCHVRFHDDSLLVADNVVKAHPSLLPMLKPATVDDGMGRLKLHVGVIGKGFILSYLWLPLVIFLLVAVAYPWLVDVGRVNLRGKTYWANQLPMSFRMLAFVAFAYCVGKVMVAVKLSWTFPYFEKLTGVVVVSAGLMLMLFYQLSLVINHDFITAQPSMGRRGKKMWKPWAALAVSLAGLGLCAVALWAMDTRFSAGMLDAYLPKEVFTLNFFKWTSSSCDGINELHRSVPYTLTLVNGAIFILLILMALPVVKRMMVKGRKMADGALAGCSAVLVGWVPKAWAANIGKGNIEAVGIALVYAIVVMAASIVPGNFSTAFITLVLVVGMSHALMHVQYTESRLWAFVTSMVITLMMLVAAIVMPNADTGYFTNYLGFACMVVLLYVLVSKYSRRTPSPAELKANKKERMWMNVIMGGVLVLVLLIVPKVLSLVDAEKVDYGRTSRRFHMFAQFENYRNSGYRYAVSDAEFMTVMVHGMYNVSGADPLSPERHPLHPSVSTGLSPVVLNDVSLPIAFFGTYGLGAYVIFFALLALLLTIVVGGTIPPANLLDKGVEVDVRMLWRLLAVLMWTCTSFYLYASYVGQFPFTGRLCPGFGVDSVGEALESATLLAFMTATLLKNEHATKRL